MRTTLKDLIIHSRSLEDILEKLLTLYAQLKKSHPRMGYVAGIITSDGPEKEEENREKLHKHTLALEKKLKYPIFSSIDIFSGEVYMKIPYYELKYEEREETVRAFWDGLLGAGYVTDIFMTPGWERSTGAKRELEISQQNGIKIHYLKT